MDFSTTALILSVSKYSRYIFRGWKAQFSIGTKQEKGRVECLWEFQIFYQGIIAQIFGKNICYFKSPISPWRGPQWKSLFWAFLLNLLWSPSTQKINVHWAPLLAFPNVWLNIFKFCLLNVCCNSLVKIWVITLSKQLDLDKYTFFSLRNKGGEPKVLENMVCDTIQK